VTMAELKAKQRNALPAHARHAAGSRGMKG
jgi:hypothetical protein